MKHANIRITGRVQGVFFRSSARDKAVELGVKGFVRNEPDGSVYAEAEADEETLQKFVAWLRQGPPGARVEDVSTEEGEMRNFDRFVVRH